MTPEIAIVDSNTLSCLGLQNLLEEIIPTAIIRSFRSFGELMDDTPDMYVHYFISSQIYFWSASPKPLCWSMVKPSPNCRACRR